jgi:hypothetical protein
MVGPSVTLIFEDWQTGTDAAVAVEEGPLDEPHAASAKPEMKMPVVIIKNRFTTSH